MCTQLPIKMKQKRWRALAGYWKCWCSVSMGKVVLNIDQVQEDTQNSCSTFTIYN